MIQKIIVSVLLKLCTYLFKLLFVYIQEELHKKTINKIHKKIIQSSEELSKPETRIQGNLSNEDAFRNLL